MDISGDNFNGEFRRHVLFFFVAVSFRIPASNKLPIPVTNQSSNLPNWTYISVEPDSLPD